MFSLKGKQVKQSWKALKLKLPSVHVVILSPLLEVIEQILYGFNQGEYGALKSTLTFIRLAVSNTIECEWILALSK